MEALDFGSCKDCGNRLTSEEQKISGICDACYDEYKRVGGRVKRVSLLARVTEDGYILGVTDDFDRGWYDDFWADNYSEENKELHPETIQIEVPIEIRDKLLRQGTSDQVYSDGYQAWQAVLDNGGIVKESKEQEIK